MFVRIGLLASFLLHITYVSSAHLRIAPPIVRWLPDGESSRTHSLRALRRLRPCRRLDALLQDHGCPGSTQPQRGDLTAQLARWQHKLALVVHERLPHTSRGHISYSVGRRTSGPSCLFAHPGSHGLHTVLPADARRVAWDTQTRQAP
jgi:hypothetical protein